MIALINCRIIDGLGNDPLENATILVEGNKIKELGPAGKVAYPEGAEIISLKGMTVLPGLIDAHVHLCWGKRDQIRWEWGILHKLAESLPTIAYRTLKRAQRTLSMGFTTLRDEGDYGFVATHLRDAINEGMFPGPRLITAGQYLVTTAGHGNAYPPWLARTDVAANVVDGPLEVLNGVRRQVKMNTDWVKFCATGGIIGWDRQFNDEEMRVLVEEAHSKDRPVSAHCIRAKGTLSAVRSGVDTVEHGMELTDEIIELMIDKGTFLIPTLFVAKKLMADPGACGLTEADLEANRPLLEGHLESFKKAWQAGVRVAAGTDCGYNPAYHGENAGEMVVLAELGLSPLEALQAGTLWAARALRIEDRLGSLEPGKLADITVVKGDPLADLSLLQKEENIVCVIKDGRIEVDRREGPV